MAGQHAPWGMPQSQAPVTALGLQPPGLSSVQHALLPGVSLCYIDRNCSSNVVYRCEASSMRWGGKDSSIASFMNFCRNILCNLPKPTRL